MEAAAADSPSDNNEHTVQAENSDRIEMDELQDMLNIVRNVTVSTDSNTGDESVDDQPMDQALLLIHKALVLLRECGVARQANIVSRDEPISIEETAASFGDAFNSVAQQVALHLNGVINSTSTEAGEESIDNSDQGVEADISSVQSTAGPQETTGRQQAPSLSAITTTDADEEAIQRNNQETDIAIPSGDAVPCPRQPAGQQESQASATTTTDSVQRASKKKGHIMISYNQSSVKICRRIYNRLKALNYELWMDIDDMYDDILESMARAIENSSIFLPCINRAYYESGYCKLEAEYAAERRVKVIPCIMEPSFRAEGWLGIIKGANMHIDFSPPNDFENSFNLLVRQIQKIENKLADTPTTETMTNTQTTTAVNEIRIMRQRFNTIIRNYKKTIKTSDVHLNKRQRKEFEQMIVKIRGNLFKNKSSENMPRNLSEVNEFLQSYLTASLGLNESMIKMQTITNPSKASSIKRNEKFHVNIDGIIQKVLAIMLGWTLATIINKD